MLQVRDICKEYRTGGYVQKALDHINLSLRDNEFVAILGPSGSGKTTLLNLIGGLDRYDSGDLVINGTSTKEYRDRDWDSYRNHSVGFIFQSYNLIPHQSVLANVELALTIAGISKKERTRRAKEALERVGLKDHVHKLPNQLSGGQMQRVAIARALINEPTVLLADEPTGALDSETSLQVMELLKEVAKDRLVVMVTHNPELANAYANRIVELRDGKVTNDTNPYVPEEAPIKDKKRFGRASMSFFTALGLSFMNLRTKLSRTLLVSFAGSIGIIGIALILALSTGTNAYIEDIQRDTLSEYPIQLQQRTIDLSSLLTERSSTEKSTENRVSEVQWVKNLLSTAETNDLGSFKEYLEEHREEIAKLARSVEYEYNVTPLIFSEQNDEVFQVHPNEVFSSLGVSSGSSLLTSYSSILNVFHLMPEESSLYEDQYDVKAGNWPTAYNETVLVLNPTGKVSDMALYAMGLKDYHELEKMIQKFATGEKVEFSSQNITYDYEDFIGLTFRLVNTADLFTYDETYGVWTDRSEDDEFVKTLVADGEELKIVGVVQPKENASATMLSIGINYTPALVSHVISEASESASVLAQKENPTINVLTGKPFDEEADAEEGSNLFARLSSLFSIDTDALKDAIQFDPTALHFNLSDLNLKDLNLSDLLDAKTLSALFPELSMQDIIDLLGTVKINVSAEGLEKLCSDLLSAYVAYAGNNASTDYTKLPDAIRTYLSSADAKILIATDLQMIIEENSGRVITKERLEQISDTVMSGFSDYLVSTGAPALDELIDQYHAGDAELADIAKLLTKSIPLYLKTDEAKALLEQEMSSLRADLSSHLVKKEQVSRLLSDLASGYEDYAKKNDLPQPSLLLGSLSAFLSTKQAGDLLNQGASNMIDISELKKQLSNRISKHLSENLPAIIESMIPKLAFQASGVLMKLMSSLQKDLPNAFQVDPNAFAKAIKLNMDSGELRSLISSFFSGESSTYDDNLSRFGYADLAKPSEIIIYPKSFDSKTELLSFIDAYNAQVKKTGYEKKVIHYTDLVGTMMNSVTDIVNAISYVLIAFVSVSLIVSSIMIGVITYISVLERRKEIGILRAIGASKHNVASVFNAETFIIGTLSGLIGVVLSGLILIPGNILIHHLSGQPDLNAVLPIPSALALILLSIVLTLIGGLIPSGSAAKSDPVAALRSE